MVHNKECSLSENRSKQETKEQFQLQCNLTTNNSQNFGNSGPNS